MKAISLWEPWASWIMLGWKEIETRTHNRFAGLAGKRIWIHASQKWDDSAILHASTWLSDYQLGITSDKIKHQRRGCLLGTVYVREHRILRPEDCRAALIECRTVRFGLILYDPKKLETPLIMNGRQGIFNVEIK